MSEPGGQYDPSGGLRVLSDPEFFACWAAVRARLVHVPEGTPGHGEVKRQYDAMSVEFRRRMDGGLA